MNQIEKQYNKWKKMSDAATNEQEQKKADKAFSTLYKLFQNDSEFKKYWESKIVHNLYSTKKEPQ